MAKMINFNTIEWHDAVLKEIFIDRKNPGDNDTLVLNIEFQDGCLKSVIFEDVYWSCLNLNFGVIAEEAILEAYTGGKENQDLKTIYGKWKGHLDDIDLNIYIFNLNSTDSVIKIIAKNFDIL